MTSNARIEKAVEGPEESESNGVLGCIVARSALSSWVYPRFIGFPWYQTVLKTLQNRPCIHAAPDNEVLPRRYRCPRSFISRIYLSGPPNKGPLAPPENLSLVNVGRYQTPRQSLTILHFLFENRHNLCRIPSPSQFRTLGPKSPTFFFSLLVSSFFFPRRLVLYCFFYGDAFFIVPNREVSIKMPFLPSFIELGQRAYGSQVRLGLNESRGPRYSLAAREFVGFAHRHSLAFAFQSFMRKLNDVRASDFCAEIR